MFSVGSVQRSYLEDNRRYELTGPLYILYIRLGFNSKIVNNRTNDSELILPTMTDKRQTRPLVREGAPNQQTRNCQTIIQIWS
jgi:hypothetical protein